MQVVSEKWKAGSKLEAMCFNPPILWTRCYQARGANSFVSEPDTSMHGCR